MLTKDAAPVLPPPLRSIPPRTLAAARKVGFNAMAKSVHGASRSSRVRRGREAGQALPPPRAPAPPHPPPAVAVSLCPAGPLPAALPSAPAATGSPPPAPSPASAASPNPRLCLFPGAEGSATHPRSEREGHSSRHGDRPSILTLRTPRPRKPPGWDSPTRSHQGAKATATQESFIQINKNELLCTNIQNHDAHFIK